MKIVGQDVATSGNIAAVNSVMVEAAQDLVLAGLFVGLVWSAANKQWWQQWNVQKAFDRS